MGAEKLRDKDPTFPYDGNNFSFVFAALRYSQIEG